jgi:hypothetical protein
VASATLRDPGSGAHARLRSLCRIAAAPGQRGRQQEDAGADHVADDERGRRPQADRALELRREVRLFAGAGAVAAIASPFVDVNR